MIRSVATGTQWSGPMKSRVVYKILISLTTESDSGSGALSRILLSSPTLKFKNKTGAFMTLAHCCRPTAIPNCLPQSLYRGNGSTSSFAQILHLPQLPWVSSGLWVAVGSRPGLRRMRLGETDGQQPLPGHSVLREKQLRPLYTRE